MTANQIAYWKLQEEKRSNLADELEAKRSNIARERETHRSNVTQESHQKSVLGETARSNRARERETKRHNVVSEFTNFLGTGQKVGSDLVKLIPIIGGL